VRIISGSLPGRRLGPGLGAGGLAFELGCLVRGLDAALLGPLLIGSGRLVLAAAVRLRPPGVRDRVTVGLPLGLAAFGLDPGLLVLGRHVGGQPLALGLEPRALGLGLSLLLLAPGLGLARGGLLLGAGALLLEAPLAGQAVAVEEVAGGLLGPADELAQRAAGGVP
jgi:hypothetical protein